ncbi:hypothetical protein FEM03_19265 [Phragmitibacter flavus]|uniref:Uncharacterized protein n=1 Tax=Phragmitibacter flavus TaxID=2576071 RepID=A0A5R8KAA6_9BACT|nr:imelysin family protein [Phragmitibacter flavus]TLD69238.1 hypothetical protein FEM03_19265 [Phragmitibacter flavus]
MSPSSRTLLTAAALASLSLTIPIRAAAETSTNAAATVQSVKDYLTKTVDSMKAASADLVVASNEYAAIIQRHGSIEAANTADAAKLDALVLRMQDNYKKIDSFGYETVEGIVAGVDSLAHYDIYLDAGVPAAEGPDDVAEVVLDLGNGEKIDKQGALFTYILEPALWGGDDRWITRISDTKTLPKPEVLIAASKDADAKIATLQSDSHAWNATVTDLFGAMVLMTPTLSDYFEDWKESRYSDQKSGRFQAVSRISDMRGIMQSCAVMFKAVKPSVTTKDSALAKSIDTGFDEILAFIDLIGKRETEGTIKPAEIDELAAQAKEKTDKIVPQIEQSAALTGVSAG